MRLVADGIVRTGRAIDARALPVDGTAVTAAVRGTDVSVTVEASDPKPVHERVGHVRPGMGLSVRTALAVAARSRGLSAPQDEKVAAVRERLAALEVPEAPTRAARRELAATGTDRLRERVAELRGRVRALRDRGLDAGDAEADLASAVRELSEAETEAVAARQRFESATAAAREMRDARERRLELEDRAANLRRAARAHLVAELEAEYAAAVSDAPGPTPADPFEADPVTAALSVGRVANLRAPVVVECDRFGAPAAAASWLDAPVIRL